MFIALTNEDRARRSAEAIDAYSDDDNRTNLVDFLADAMHSYDCMQVFLQLLSKRCSASLR